MGTKINPAETVCEIMKACRDEWKTTPDIAEETDAAGLDTVRRYVKRMAAQGLLETTKTQSRYVRGGLTVSYRVAPAWRGE